MLGQRMLLSQKKVVVCLLSIEENVQSAERLKALHVVHQFLVGLVMAHILSV